MLELLRASIDSAKRFGVPGPDALSLVGRAIFWRFLVDRGLLDGIDPGDVSPGAKDWPECLGNKTRALATFAWLGETFNGGLLAFSSSPREMPAEVFQKVVGSIAYGATPEGQLPLRLPRNWQEVNFAHLPVGLMSEVYEAYAHTEDSRRAKSDSIFYTPRHIAELVVDEAMELIADVENPRVLDPAAGAGVFLVAVFRALVSREWHRTNKRPSRQIVRRILNRQLTGFDINGSALRLAELALYLTAIELDPERKPRPLKLLQFEELRDRVLFERRGGRHEGSLAPVEKEFRGVFDLVIGNPPWTASAPAPTKKKWVHASLGVVTERLGEERASSFDFPDTNPDLPFVYRSMEWARTNGGIALVTHGRWLFGQTESWNHARRDLLQSIHVTGILNGAALRDTSVWPNVRHPFCLLFAANETPPDHAAFRFVSPELDTTPDRGQHRFRIDWHSSQELAIEEVIETPWLLKARFRCSPFDESLLRHLQSCGQPLGTYLATLGVKLRNGYIVGGHAGKQTSAKHLKGLPDLGGSEPTFVIDTNALPSFSRPTLLRPRDRSNYSAPLLLVHESMRASSDRPRAILSFQDLAFDERFDGASFARVPHGVEIARYLQLVIQSSVFQLLLLMLDAQFGIEREVVHKKSIEAVPVTPWNALSKEMKGRAREISACIANGLTPSLASKIDLFVSDIFGLSKAQRESVIDTLGTRLPTATSKSNALREPSPNECDAFAKLSETTMSDVLCASGRRAFVRTRGDLPCQGWQILQVDTTSLGADAPPLAKPNMKRFVDAAQDVAASLVRVHVAANRTLVGVPSQYRYFTPTRARMLAAAILESPHET